MSSRAQPEEALDLSPALARQLRRLADCTHVHLSLAAAIPYPRYVAFERGRLALTAEERHRVCAALLPRLAEALAPLLTVDRDALVRQFRRLADRSQVQLARDAGIGCDRYIAFENARVRLEAEELRRVFAVLEPRVTEALALLPSMTEPQ